MIHKKIDVRCRNSQEYAALYTYLLDDSVEIPIKTRPIIIVCPGGGYALTSDREAEIIAMQFLAMGYHAAVLRYSVAPAVFPTAILELGRAINILRENAEMWHIDTEKIIPIGFSAGGHMVASYCMFWNKDFVKNELNCDNEILRPNAMVLAYPVITSGEFAHVDSIKNILGNEYESNKEQMSLEYQVSRDVPKAFIWHTFEDNSVPVQNSLFLVNAMVANKIPVEYHIFEKGMHGLALANRLTVSNRGNCDEPSCECWIELLHRWIENL